MLAALAVRLEFKRAFHQATNGVGEETCETVEAVKRLAVALGQGRFVIPRIDLTMATVGKIQITDLALGAKCGRLGDKVLVPARPSCCNKLHKPSEPTPMPHRCNIARRLTPPNPSMFVKSFIA